MPDATTALPFLAGLPAGQQAAIAAGAAPASFAAGSYLFRADDAADRLYLIDAGRVALEVTAPGRGRVAFQTLGPGEPVGLSWLAPPHRWQFDARAVEPVTATAIDATRLRALAAADPDLERALLARFLPVLLGRLQAARRQLLDVYGNDR